MVESEMSSNQAPKLLEAWIQQQERLKHLQMAQQQTAAIEYMKHLYNHQQNMASTLRPPAPTPLASSADISSQQALMFNLFYHQVRYTILNYCILYCIFTLLHFVTNSIA